MRKIQLEFTSVEQKNLLFNDTTFINDISYLKYTFCSANGVILTDPNENNNYLDTEIVVLSKFARAFKRLVFPTTNYDIEFLAVFANKKKEGIQHNGEILINVTQIEMANIELNII